jgi:hypothetical protein
VNALLGIIRQWDRDRRISRAAVRPTQIQRVTCEWCGHEHAREALCTSRPKWSRRGFLSLFGAGIAGLAVAPSLGVRSVGPEVVIDMAFTAGRRGGKTVMGLDAILKAYYEPVIVEMLNDKGVLMSHIMPRNRVPLLHEGKPLRVHAR